MNSSSPANSSISTTAIVGGGASASSAALEDFHFRSDLISIQDRKDEAMLVLKSDLMASLNDSVKSLDEDNWMFEGPRSRIHMISRPVFVLHDFVKSSLPVKEVALAHQIAIVSVHLWKFIHSFIHSFEVMDCSRWISTEADGVHKESEHGPAKMISDFLRLDEQRDLALTINVLIICVRC
ncbi:hypothetical protein DITRI_Ditri04bG0088000 [Diplodiscus trichospermus]